MVNIYLTIIKQAAVCELSLQKVDTDSSDTIKRLFAEALLSCETFDVFTCEAAARYFCRKAREILNDGTLIEGKRLFGSYYFLFLSFLHIFEKVGFNEKSGELFAIQHDTQNADYALGKARMLFGEDKCMQAILINNFIASTAIYALMISCAFDCLKDNYDNSEILAEINVLNSMLSDTSLKEVLTRNTKPEHPKQSGCYIATCVYGSYDCPEVWVLRRYRDYKLHNTWLGRWFIRCYYAISPKMVKKYGNKESFKAFFKKKLDKLVAKYKEKGFEDTPYNDLY